MDSGKIAIALSIVAIIIGAAGLATIQSTVSDISQAKAQIGKTQETVTSEIKTLKGDIDAIKKQLGQVTRAVDIELGDLEAAARKEGRLTIIRTLDTPDNQNVVEGFRSKYPEIKVETVEAISDVVLARVLEEIRLGKPGPDIIGADHLAIGVLRKQGLLAKYLPPEVQEFGKGSVAIDPEGYWFFSYMAPAGVAYNTKLVQPKDVPKKVADLLDPKWKGKILADDPTRGGFGPIFWEAVKKLPNYQDVLKKLYVDQQPRIDRGGTAIARLLIAGERDIVIAAHITKVLSFKFEANAPVDIVFLEDLPTGFTGEALGLSAKAEHPNAAKLFLRFQASKAGMELLARRGIYMPARFDVKTNYDRIWDLKMFLPTRGLDEVAAEAKTIIGR